MADIRNIIVPTDFSECSRAAMVRAASLARLDGAAIRLVHALRFPLIGDPYDVSVPDAVFQGVRRGVEQKIEDFRKELADAGIADVTATIAESSDPIHAVEEAIAEHDAELVVMGTHGYGGIKHAVLGSVAERIIRSVACPVLAVKGDAETATEPIRKILAPVDFSEHSDEAARVAAEFAKKTGASLDLLHAVDSAPEYAAHLPPEALEIEQKMREIGTERLDAVARSIAGTNVNVELHLVRGSPAQAISDEAQRLGSDLIVMGTHGRTGFSHLFLGSVAERTLRSAPCAVLAVKHLEGASKEG